MMNVAQKANIKINKMNLMFWINIHWLIFISTFPVESVPGEAAQGSLEKPHGFQQSQMLLLAAYQDGTK